MKLSATQRRVVIGLAIAAVSAAVLFFPAIYFIGLALAPPRPTASTQDVPPVLADAIWARIDGGRATETQPVNPLNLAGFAVCNLRAEFAERPDRDARHEECSTHMAGFFAAEYFGRVHLRDERLLPGTPRYALAGLATGAWISRSFSKRELIDTLAERVDFPFGWRGADQAAQGFFGRSPAELSLPQTALLAAFVMTVGGRELGLANSWVDPWCDPPRAAAMRNAVLEKMHANGAIDQVALDAASVAELGLTSRPDTLKPCGP